MFSAAAAESFDLQLIGSLQPGAQHLKKVLAEHLNEHQRRPRSVLMLVGPEGDFTPAELALARRNGSSQLRSVQYPASGNRSDLLPERSLLRITDLAASGS